MPDRPGGARREERRDDREARRDEREVRRDEREERRDERQDAPAVPTPTTPDGGR